MARGISFAFLIVAAATGCLGDDPATNPGTSSGGVDAGPTNTGLVENGGFENGCEEPLFFSNGSFSPDPTARTGGKSCKVCRTPGGESSLYLYARLGFKPKVGEVYEVSAWMRNPPGIKSGGPADIAIGGTDSGDSPNDDAGGSVGPDAITDVWKEAKASWTVSKDGAERVRVNVGLPTAADNICFLIDDLAVTKK